MQLFFWGLNPKDVSASEDYSENKTETFSEEKKENGADMEPVEMPVTEVEQSEVDVQDSKEAENGENEFPDNCDFFINKSMISKNAYIRADFEEFADVKLKNDELIEKYALATVVNFEQWIEKIVFVWYTLARVLKKVYEEGKHVLHRNL